MAAGTDRGGGPPVRKARTGTDIRTVRELFLEYASSLGVDLSYQGFDRELAALPGDYAAPSGTLLLLGSGPRTMGCVAVRRFAPGICEMKRLYVREEFRGRQLGRALAEAAVSWARRAGYRRMRLDTLPSMQGAQELYRRLGFVEIESYRFSPVPGTRFMELQLPAPRRRVAGRAARRRP
jgi:ribosomal protein S18 acetylase RimI-like enzyme